MTADGGRPGGEKIVVGVVKWGERYGPDYVNVLYRAVGDHLDRPHRFVCVTDEAEGLDHGIEVAPMPRFATPRETWRVTNLAKVALLAPGVVAEDEVVLQIDLDVMILGELGAFFDLYRARPAFYTLREWNPAVIRATLPRALWPDRGSQGSVNLYKAADQRHLWQEFDRNTHAVLARYRTDRFYYPAAAKGQAYLPYEWVQSFKNQAAWYWPLSLAFAPRPPDDARILAFHGRPRPADLLGPPGKRWGTKRKFGFEPVPWVVDYWTRYGGSLPAA
ncbi:hypothetical protein BH23PSE1_BH23PSE1_09220 [soil metagenome]